MEVNDEIWVPAYLQFQLVLSRQNELRRESLISPGKTKVVTTKNKQFKSSKPELNTIFDRDVLI